MAIGCPKCFSDKTSVTDSRKESNAIRRRVICLECGYRYSTVEVVCDLSKKGFKRGTTARTKMERAATANSGVYNDVAELLKQAITLCHQGNTKEANQ